MSKSLKNLAFYIVMLFGCMALIYGIVKLGRRFEDVPTIARPTHVLHFFSGGLDLFVNSLDEHIQKPIAMLLLQIIAILCIARIFGYLFVKIGQSSVVGEILAGIVLGPSLLGHFLPGVSNFLFSPESLCNISILSQIGLIFFMFVIGMELDIVEVQKKINDTIIISHTGIIFPFLCGTVAAYVTYPCYAAHTTFFFSYALFIGISMSVTAFPVLARIIQEKRLTKSHLGVLSLASAATGDILAWCLLAIIIAVAQTGTFVGALYILLFTVLFIIFMFFVLRPFLNIVGNVYHNKEVLNKTVVAFMFIILIISSYLTEVLGIHALFGAFMAGVVMPSHIQFRKILTEKVEDVALTIFLPLFFVLTGLKTQIGLISGMNDWLICVFFIFLAVFGKIIGTAIPARFTGESWKDSWLIGALMNTRGLMELVILTIGYEMNIFPPSIFTMLVLMTLVTTFMTSPLLSFIEYCYRVSNPIVVRQKNDHFSVLLSFGRANNGRILLNVAQQVFSKGIRQPEITALHLTVGAEVNPMYIDSFETVSFAPILEEAYKLNFPIKTQYDVTNDVRQYIVSRMKEGAFDFLLIGAGISMSPVPADIEAAKHTTWFYPSDLVKDKTPYFIEEIHATVGIFVNRGFELATDVLVVLKRPQDVFLLRYANNLIASNGVQITISEVGDLIAKNRLAVGAIRDFLNDYPNAGFFSSNQLSETLFYGRNLMLITYETWMDISEHRKETLQAIPSTLIIRKSIQTVDSH